MFRIGVRVFRSLARALVACLCVRLTAVAADVSKKVTYPPLQSRAKSRAAPTLLILGRIAHCMQMDLFMRATVTNGWPTERFAFDTHSRPFFSRSCGGSKWAKLGQVLVPRGLEQGGKSLDGSDGFGLSRLQAG